jgi:hypothetical protein
MLRLPALVFLLVPLLAGQHLSIFLHAAPLNPRFAQLQPSDVAASISSLKTLTESLPARSVRLVVFSLSLDKELYRSDSFTATDLPAITQILSTLQLGMVDYHVLQQHRLLRSLIDRELNESAPSSKVVFIGPDAFAKDKLLPSQATRIPAGQHVFYLQYRMDSFVPFDKHPARRTTDPEPHPLVPCQGGSLYGCNNGGNSAQSPTPPPLDIAITNPEKPLSDPDPHAIASLMHKLKAKTFVISNSADFNRAVNKIARF